MSVQQLSEYLNFLNITDSEFNENKRSFSFTGNI